MLENLSDHHAVKSKNKGSCGICQKIKKDVDNRDLHPGLHKVSFGLYPEKDGDP